MKTPILSINNNFLLNLDIENNVNSEYDKIMSTISVVKVILIIFIIITIISIIALINFNIYTRMKEIGIYKSIGTSSKNIKRMFTYEITMLAIISCIFCYPIALLFINLFSIVTNKLFSTNSLHFKNEVIYPDISSYSMVILAGLLLIYISSFIPIRNITKLPIVETLKENKM